jgi:topoisomerase-4 subunit A
LNADEKGQYLGMFDADDKILVAYSDGNYEITDQELTQKLDAEKVLLIEKFDPEKLLQLYMLIWIRSNTW